MGKDSDCFERAGIQMIRQGRFIATKNTFSGAEHAQFQENLARFHEEAPSLTAGKAAEIEAELAQYASFDILANVAFAEQFLNPEIYKEWAHEGRQAYAEYLTLLALKRPFRPEGDPIIDRPKIERLRGLVEEVFQLTTWYYVSERVVRGGDLQAETTEYFRYRVITQNLMVRAPGYPHHLKDLHKGLFAQGAVAQWMKTSLGFSVEQAIDINDAIARRGFEELRRTKTSWVSICAAPVRSAQGDLLGAVVTIVDITSQYEFQERREDLLRAVSHDLRTPLTVILARAQILSRMLGKPEKAHLVAESADAIVAADGRMLATIQDMSDMVRAESGQLRVSKERVDLRPILVNPEALVGSEAANRITVEVHPNAPEVIANGHYVERIRTNLLTNALKYSEPGSEVVVRAELQGSDMSISVVDRVAA